MKEFGGNMNTFLTLNHTALMYISFLIMLSLTIIRIGYCVLGKKGLSCKYTILGNVSYMLFFFIVSASIGGKVFGSHIWVAFLDLTSVILWMMGLNTITSMDHPRKLYIISSISNVVLIGVIFEVSQKYSLIRAITSIFIVIVLVDIIIRYYKNVKIKKLDTYKFTVITLIIFSVFKSVMIVYRFYSIGYENSILRMSMFASVNVLTLGSLIFAIWVNFSIVFLSYDRLNNNMKELSLHDYLTKLPNRRMISNKLDEFVNLYFRGKLYFAIVILDLDNFKRVNDTYGHNIGDEVLEDFSALLREDLRGIDFVGRYGGEEFILVLLEEDLVQVRAVLDRLMSDLNGKELSSCRINITVSGGVVLLDRNSDFKDINNIIAIADNRLYIAKENGKNQIVYEG